MKTEKLENLHDKNEYVIQMKNLKQALSPGLVLKKVHKVIKVIKILGKNHTLI